MGEASAASRCATGQLRGCWPEPVNLSGCGVQLSPEAVEPSKERAMTDGRGAHLRSAHRPRASVGLSLASLCLGTAGQFEAGDESAPVCDRPQSLDRDVSDGAEFVDDPADERERKRGESLAKVGGRTVRMNLDGHCPPVGVRQTLGLGLDEPYVSVDQPQREGVAEVDAEASSGQVMVREHNGQGRCLLSSESD